MKTVKIAIWMFVLALIETALSRYIAIGGVMPAVMLAFCVCFVAMEESFPTMLAVQIIAGICMGALGSGEMWFEIIRFTYTGTLCSAAVRVLFKGKHKFLTVILVSIVMSFAAEMMYYLMNVGVTDVMGAGMAALRVALPAAVYTTAIAAALYYPIKATVYREPKNDILIV